MVYASPSKLCATKKHSRQNDMDWEEFTAAGSHESRPEGGLFANFRWIRCTPKFPIPVKFALLCSGRERILSLQMLHSPGDIKWRIGRADRFPGMQSSMDTITLCRYLITAYIGITRSFCIVASLGSTRKMKFFAVLGSLDGPAWIEILAFRVGRSSFQRSIDRSPRSLPECHCWMDRDIAAADG
jgi:hypothetical protein